MENVINKILLKEIKPKLTNDIILTELFKKEILIANKYKIIQMRLGKIYEELAKFNEWVKVEKIDLININKKYAIELKSSTQTDNSSSRERNFDKLLEFKEKHSEYELFYLCINHTTKECQKIKLENEITFLTGKHALEFLYGENYEEVISTIRKCVKDFINSDTSKLRETCDPERRSSINASTTTSSEKSFEGTEVMTLPNGNNVEV